VPSPGPRTHLFGMKLERERWNFTCEPAPPEEEEAAAAKLAGGGAPVNVRWRLAASAFWLMKGGCWYAPAEEGGCGCEYKCVLVVYDPVDAPAVAGGVAPATLGNVTPPGCEALSLRQEMGLTGCAPKARVWCCGLAPAAASCAAPLNAPAATGAGFAYAYVLLEKGACPNGEYPKPLMLPLRGAELLSVPNGVLEAMARAAATGSRQLSASPLSALR